MRFGESRSCCGIRVRGFGAGCKVLASRRRRRGQRRAISGEPPALSKRANRNISMADGSRLAADGSPLDWLSMSGFITGDRCQCAEHGAGGATASGSWRRRSAGAGAMQGPDPISSRHRRPTDSRAKRQRARELGKDGDRCGTHRRSTPAAASSSRVGLARDRWLLLIVRQPWRPKLMFDASRCRFPRP